MCGIFGFVSTGGSPDIGRLKVLALANQSRGEDAFGLLWFGDALKIRKRPGKASDNLRDLEPARDARVVMGHCRWATNGDPLQNANNHPHRSGSGAYVHNGTVANHRDLTTLFSLARSTECDTEVLGRLIARFRGTLANRVRAAVRLADGPLALLGVWPKPLPRIVIVRRGKPLWVGSAAEGIYLSSVRAGLPANASEVGQGMVSISRLSVWEKYSRNLG